MGSRTWLDIGRLGGAALVLLLAGAIERAAQAQVAPKPVAPQPAPEQLVPGLSVVYYAHKFNFIDEIIDWENYRKGAPGPDLPALDYKVSEGKVLSSNADDEVGARITGLIHLPDSGTYTFTAQSNDGVRVWLGAEQILDDPDVHADRFSDPVEVQISEGGWYDLTVLYFEKKNTSTLQLYWLRPGDDAGTMLIVPPEAFAHLKP